MNPRISSEAEYKIKLPQTIVVNANVLPSIEETLTTLGIKKDILCLSGNRSFAVLGEKVLRYLKQKNLKVETQRVNHADRKEVKRIEKLIKNLKTKIVITVGGGRTIDVGKLASFRGKIPFISIPTNASHDGICSPQAVVSDLNTKFSITAHPPLAVFADLKIISQAPGRFFRAGVGDVLSNLNALADWKLAKQTEREEIDPYAFSLSEACANLLLDKIHLFNKSRSEGIRYLVEALIGSGLSMCIANSSRPASGAEHQFAHALDSRGENQALHGEKCGVGTIMMLYLHRREEWKRVKEALSTIGAPVTARELKIPAKKIIEALTLAHKIRNRYTILGEKGLTYKEATRLAEATGVI